MAKQHDHVIACKATSSSLRSAREKFFSTTKNLFSTAQRSKRCSFDKELSLMVCEMKVVMAFFVGQESRPVIRLIVCSSPTFLAKIK